MSVRTYNPSVRVGNWNEDIQLEEDTLKDFLERRERGELLIQKSAHLRESVLSPAQLSVSRDGKVHFGETAMLINPEPKDHSRKSSALSLNMSEGGAGHPNGCSVSASGNVSPSARTTLVIGSVDGSSPGSTLKYGQKFAICTASEGFGQTLYLHSDRATFQRSAKKSRHNEVTFVSEPSNLTDWKVLPFDPLYRMELEYTDVPANQKVIIVHAKTNDALCLEAEFSLRTPFGREYEVSGFTSYDSHKAERDCNHWTVTMNVPGDSTRPVEPPQN